MRIMGGLLVSAYLRTVFLWIPNSLVIARMERPRRLACCTGFHRTLCRGVGFLCGDAGGLRTLLSPFNVVLSASMTPRAARLFLGSLPTPLTLRSRPGPYRRGPCLERLICVALPWSESFSVGWRLDYGCAERSVGLRRVPPRHMATATIMFGIAYALIATGQMPNVVIAAH